MSSLHNCTNTDISGIGIRSATYAQNLLSFVPAAVALFNDGKISNSEREFIKDQSTNILLTAFGLLLSAIIQAKTAQGLDNYHLALVLNLSWLNNTNTFIYLVLCLHRKMWSSPSDRWRWSKVFRHIFFHRSPRSSTGHPVMVEESGAQKPETLLDVAVVIGSLHLSLMGAVGVWLWSNPMAFGTSTSCPPNAAISVLARTFPMASSGLRIISLMFYAAVLLPIINLILPTALVLMPYFLFPLGKSDPKKQEWVAVRCVALGLLLLFIINVIFIINTELSISQNESRQAGQDSIWTLGQTLALLLLVLPIRGLVGYLLTTTSLVLPFMGETDWGRAVRGFRRYDPEVSWSEVYRWRWLVGDTPVKADSDWLLHALLNGQLDIEHFLCDNGADWSTVMAHAAEQGHLDIVRYVVEKGVEVNGGDALRYAAEKGHVEIVCFLVDKGADVKQGYPLPYAAAKGHLEIVRILVEKGADINQAAKGHLEIVRILVEKGADINQGDPLYHAAVKGHLEIVRILVEKGADINQAAKGHLEIVRILVEKGADINQGYALPHAAAKGHLEIVHILVEKGADINQGDPLYHAAVKGHLEMVRILVDKGADVNRGYALEDAAHKGHLEILRFLVDKGAHVNRGNPLYCAADKGHPEIVHFLVDKGADVNRGDILYHAAEKGHLEIVCILVDKGADVNRESYTRKRPLDIAVEQGHTEIVSFLRSHGGIQTTC
ncbi:ankyrin repeat-containing domain protein [Mycena amicta]|nr:ankyrin repeat-containing domain protein [Mycena amicta]